MKFASFINRTVLVAAAAATAATGTALGQTYKIGDKHPDGGLVAIVDASGNKGIIVEEKDSGPFTPPEAIAAGKAKGAGWGLPNINDLRLVYSNLHKQGKGDFQPKLYQAGDASSAQYRKGLHFNDGKEETGIAQNNKVLVRFVRAFSSKAPATAAAPAPSPSSYKAQVQWGGPSAPWQEPAVWVIGGRKDQAVVGLDIKSTDGGKTLTGTMTYAGEGPIRIKAAMNPKQPNYKAQVQWGAESSPWVDQGSWVVGGRKDQAVIALQIKSADGGKTLTGTTTYAGEQPITFKAEIAK